MALKEKEENIDTETRKYEVGFSIVPIIAEEEIPGEFTKIKDILESFGGVVEGSELPKRIGLAYKIAKEETGGRTWYDAAYFGWMRFSILPERMLELKNKLRNHEPILRFLLILAGPEKSMPSPRMTFVGGKRAKPKEKASERPMLSEAEIDKTIEELITADVLK